MPPQRTRNGLEDTRSEASSTRDKQNAYVGMSKARRNGMSSLKDVTNVETNESGQQSDAAMDWLSFDTSVLHAYRYRHRLDAPPAFISSYNQRMLTRPGVGQYSPTMARRRARRRNGKDVLALAVRKDFNAAIVLESELITSFLYTIQNQDKNFRMRFEPSQAR